MKTERQLPGRLYVVVFKMSTPAFGAQRFVETVRVFARMADARRHVRERVGQLAAECDPADKYGGNYVETAYVCRVNTDGTLAPVWEFDGLDRGDGMWGGWSKYSAEDEMPTTGLGRLLSDMLAGLGQRRQAT